MSQGVIATFAKGAMQVAKKHGPEILMGLGIAGFVGTVITAVSATPKAITLIEERKQEIEEATQEKVEKLPPIETVKATWKCYIPAAIMGVASVGCLIGSSSESIRRNTALAAAYTLSETTRKEYKEKVLEQIGPKKEAEIRDAVAKDKLEKVPLNSKEVVVTGKGESRCFDVLSGRRFTSDIEKVRKAENELNRRMRDENYISLNDFYCEIGLDPIKIGEDLGWNIETGYIDLHFSAQIDEDDQPSIVLDYNIAPRYGYTR